MSASPTLSAEATHLLKTLDSVSRTRKEFLRGGEVMKLLGVPRDEFVKLLDELGSQDLVRVAGPRTPDKIDFAVISVHPANREFVRAL